MIITILTILNTLTLLAMLLKDKISFDIERSFHKKTPLRFVIYIRITEGMSKSYWFTRIPLRNVAKTELRENIELLKASNNKAQSLTAMFSWLKTQKEVDAFIKNYVDIDPITVGRLVEKWSTKTKKDGAE